MYGSPFNPFVKLSKKAKAEREASLTFYRYYLRLSEKEVREPQINQDFVKSWEVALNGVQD